MSTNLRNYGDLGRLKEDLRTLQDIYKRQGTELIIDSLAENVVTTLNKFGLDCADQSKAAMSLVNDLKEQLSERI